MNTDKNYEPIPKELFEFARSGETLHDEKMKTKARGYFADAMLRFKKNKSSVVAAWIILGLVVFAIVAPLLTPYNIRTDKDTVYTKTGPYVRWIADLDIGIWDGAVIRESQNETQMRKWEAIGIETGMEPLIRIVDEKVNKRIDKGQEITYSTYRIETNKYYETGIVYRVLSVAEFEKIQHWQNETGIQVIYPYVVPEDISGIKDNPNIWYQVKDSRGTPVLDDNGDFIPAYSTNKAIEGAEYNSIRVDGDDGSYIYSARKSGAVQCRVCYYNYYIYLNGHEPMYIFGTNELGQDLFTAIGIGARFSIVFAIVVSAINLTIGAIYGAIQGYYGGYVDLTMYYISDVLSGVPFIVTVTLFQLYLAEKVGVAGSFLFAFVLTGWLGMAALTRKQFYRFKSQEFVLAARTLGASDWRLMFKHIFPNSLGTIITSCALIIPGVIGSETTLTYLGIINLSELVGTSIGVLMAQGQTSMTTAPHAMFYPALFLSLMLICFNLFGNGLRDAFNPSMRGAED